MDAFMVHWIEDLVDQLAVRAAEKEVFVANGGLSVSGLQHVGRLRGEITIIDAVVRLLSGRGVEARHMLTLYTVDAWKGKEAQLRQFRDLEEARAYTGMPLYMVPDPYGCHSNWVEHYWEDFGNFLDSFSGEVEVVTTRDLYERNERMREFVLLSVTSLRGEVVSTINKYRGEKKLHQEYIPFQPICEKCGRVDATETLEVDPSNYRVRYLCRNCGREGWQSLSKGKLNWRVEWVGVWYALRVDFEPYGKDHATPGGSRDSCNELAEKVYGFKPPAGLAYEWVGYRRQGKDLGDMGSSDFIGFSPRQWLEVAEGEVLRFIYLSTPPTRRVVLSLEEVPYYYDEYDKAERVYYGVEEGEAELARSYMLAALKPLSENPPFQLRYINAMILSQVLPSRGENVDEVLGRLLETKQLKRELSDFEVQRIKTRVALARRWLQLYAPPHYRISIVDVPPIDEVSKVIDAGIRGLLVELRERLSSLQDWSEGEIKKAMMSLERTPQQEKQFFKALYLAFFGKEHGPRLAPYLAMLSKDFVIKRLTDVIACANNA
jgi:lysyl-tRNA synthetase class 1